MIREHYQRITVAAAVTGVIGALNLPALAQENHSSLEVLTPTPIQSPDKRQTPTLISTATKTATLTRTPTLEPIKTPTPTPTEEVTSEEAPWTAVAKISSYCDRGLTFSGIPAGPGIIAVDPRVIPLGSRVDIDTLGEGYLAADTGSKVRGWHADVWDSSCSWAINWGIRDRSVRVTRWGWEE